MSDTMKRHVRHHSLLCDACTIMASNIRELLEMSGLPATRGNVLKIINSLPVDESQLRDDRWREGACNDALKTAHERHGDTPEMIRVRELTDYFIGFAYRMPEDRDMLIAAFQGVLSTAWEE